MIETIVKRDGRKVKFDVNKISNAIYMAAQSVGGNDMQTAKKLADKVVNQLEKLPNPTPGIEEIQDCVEKVLIKNGYAKTAKEYILYRANRTHIREMNTKLMKIYEDLTFKLAKDSDVKRENANIDGDTSMGTMLKYGSEGAKHFFEMYVLDPKLSKAHKDGDIHIHDLDFLTLTTTCCQIDLEKLFDGGFSTGHGYLREPNDISSYSALACIAVQANQNDQHGGQSVPNFDYALAKGVFKTFKSTYYQNLFKAMNLLLNEEINYDSIAKNIISNSYNKTGFYPSIKISSEYLTEEYNNIFEYTNDDKITSKIQKFAYTNALKETDRKTFQAMEALVHNLNTMHSRAGAQVPFSSINYGTDTSEEGRMVIKNMLLATERGLGNSETPIFPVQIFKVKEGINYDAKDPNYDLFKLACRVSAKRLFPNFAFIDSPFNLQYYKKGKPETEVAYMGCRTRVIANNVDHNREIVNGRGNLSFTSVNLPRLAILSDKNTDKFYELLDDRMELVLQQLLSRFELQAKKKVRNFPFLMGQGIWIDSDKLSLDDEIREVIKHGTLTVGFIGLAECLKCLTGKHHGESEDSQKLGLEIIKKMRNKTDGACKKYNLNFSLIATPAEGLSGRFVKLDREKFGVIEGITDKDFYTNSFHIPVYYNISALKKIKLEAPYHALTNGGHISYIELDGDPAQNLEAFEKIIRCMKEHEIGYGAINHPVDRDPVCGFTGIIGDECPKCKRTEQDNDIKFERIRRITGYLVGTLDRFNNAKREEEKNRVKHKV
ncbi:MAG: anaerobic ribonucleoside triphosphate reductase [Oscillospiraceae bacterium]|jgi:ribonucleoside-triphosphate reductase|nr:anaerobic ribonucleoside triphosphate reductase [Oscillospiraceae bacterium]